TRSGATSLERRLASSSLPDTAESLSRPCGTGENPLVADQLKDAAGYAGPKIDHPTVEERAARGKAARPKAPRSRHAAQSGPARDPVALLDAQAVSRLPELVPIRYGRMLTSPFAFFRGGAAIMAHDLAATPSSGLDAQLCGDAHLSNFGGFASPERDLVLDL